ncbi:MAG: SSU ribosomal protein S2p (SAe) [Rhodanobacteraceae bacterium]|jgi:hypothetical protein|nr:MAG: SSU ribosomal protein S2p (SAe) [Rhodanobacteraceae bacterium]
MKTILALAGSVLLAAALAACSPGVNEGLANRITFDSNGMVVHAIGRPNAHVSRDGDLRIDGKSIAVTPAQRQLLQQYYRQATGVMNSGMAMGKQGVQMAARGVGDAIASIFHGDSSTTDKRMNADSQHIEAAANQLCASVKSLGTTQDAIAAQIPAFKPYAAADRMQCRITHTVTINDNGTVTTSTRTSDSPTAASPSKP